MLKQTQFVLQKYTRNAQPDEKLDQETIDASSWGERTAKTSHKEPIQNTATKQDLKQVTTKLQFDLTPSGRDYFDALEQEREDNSLANEYDNEKQIKKITQNDFKEALSKDLLDLRQRQWLIKTFRKNNLLIQYVSSAIKRAQTYFKSDSPKTQPKSKSKLKPQQMQEYLIDEFSKSDTKVITSTKEQDEFNLICQQYVFSLQQKLIKSQIIEYAPYKQRYLESTLMVVDDKETFKRLSNDDQRNETCQCIKQIEKNIIGKDQKKYARQLYRSFISFILKQTNLQTPQKIEF